MSAADDDDRTILVSNIPTASISASHLQDLFGMVGKIVELNFVASTGQCWIEYAKNEGAKASLYLAGTQLGDRALNVTLKSAMPPPLTEAERAAAEAAAAAPAAAVPAPATSPVPFALPTATPLLTPSPPTPLLSLPLVPGALPLLPSPSASSGAAMTPFESLMASNPALQALHAQQLGATAPLVSPLGGAGSFGFGDPSFTSRTVYVGNLGPEASDQFLRVFFAPIGVVVATRFSGDAGSSRYAFVEFAMQESANVALGWDGTTMIDRSIKVGKAQNSITKFAHAPPPHAQAAMQPVMMGAAGAPKPQVDPARISAAMEKVRAAQAAIAAKLAGADSYTPAPTAPTGPIIPFVMPVITSIPQSVLPSALSVSASGPGARAEESKEAPKRSRSRSRSPRRPDYAERQRLKREQEAMNAQRYGYPPMGGYYQQYPYQQQQQQQQPSFDRWGSTPDDRSDRKHRSSSHRSSRDRSRDRSRERSHDRDRHRQHPYQRERNARQGPPPSAVPLAWDGFQWQPAAPVPTMPPQQ